MKISYRWLARHIDLSGLSAEQVAADLTLSTCEVESVERFAPCLSDVTVGHVLTREKHPDADKLSVCSVDIGQGAPLQIVCGAPNVRAGLKVAVATVGTSLAPDFKIKKSKIRGVESCGMICSERELGLGEDHEGIWELDGAAALGQPVAAALDLADFVIEIDNKSLTHRPDLWGHRGFARELSAIYQRPLKPLDTSLPPAGALAPFPVRIESKACARFMALCLEGAANGKSPLWLRTLLLAVGQRPIDVLVDVSNFVMLDLAQPNHLFDRRRLSSEGIVVRDARAGERLTTLDGIERKLEPADLLICAGPKPIGLAGVMGGEETKVASDTTALVLEVASFHAATIRRTASRLALRTDASARFEKTLANRDLPEAAAGHLVRTLQSIQPAVRLSAPVTDQRNEQALVAATAELSILLRPERVRKLLGVALDDAAISAILKRLGLAVSPADKPGWVQVKIPCERATKDLTEEQDLVEEVGRIHRFGNIPTRALLETIRPPQLGARRAIVRKLEDRLALAAGFHQTISYSFLADSLRAKLGIEGLPHSEVVNPVAEGLSAMRRSVVPSLLGLLESNRRHGQDVRLFEVGKGYLPYAPQEAGISPTSSAEPKEVHELGLVWARPPKAKQRFDEGVLAELHAVVADLLPALGRADLVWGPARTGELPAFAHPVRALVGRADKAPDARAVAVLAELEPSVRRALGLVGDLDSEVAFAALSIDDLQHAVAALATRYHPVSSFPGIKVDVALALPSAVPAADALAAIERAAKGLARGIELFDVYSGPNIAAGHRSLAFHVVLEDSSKTLEDKDRHKFLERLAKEAQGLGGELRAES